MLYPTESCIPYFGIPILLKCKVDVITANAPLPLPVTPLPPPPSKWPCCNHDLLNWMRGLLQAGAQHLDTLHMSQMAAQEASGVMAVVMLRKQGEMREVLVWELEVEAQ